MFHDTFEYTTSIDQFTGDITIELSSPHDLEELGHALATVHQCVSHNPGRSLYVVAVDSDTGERTVLNDPDGDECLFTQELIRIAREQAEARQWAIQRACQPLRDGDSLFDLNEFSLPADDSESSL